jgi:hypothetical protein
VVAHSVRVEAARKNIAQLDGRYQRQALEVEKTLTRKAEAERQLKWLLDRPDASGGASNNIRPASAVLDDDELLDDE